jgi:hypothetical protein
MTDSAVMPADENDEIFVEKEGTDLVSDGLAPLDGDAKSKKFNTIKWLHFGAAIFFLIQTIAFGAVDANISIVPTVGFPTYCNELFEKCPGAFDSKPFLKYLKATNPIWLIPLFTALASFDHFVSYFLCVRYAELAKLWIFDIQSNPLRWIEYCISASVMALAIAILCGISDVHLWFSIFWGHFVGILMGLLIEILPVDKASSMEIQQTQGLSFLTMKRILFGLSCVSIFIPWMVMICYFLVSVKNGDGVPDFVYLAFFGTLVLFAAFAVNTYLNKIVNRYDFATTEIIFISLSFTAKTFLAADVFGGLRANE